MPGFLIPLGSGGKVLPDGGNGLPGIGEPHVTCGRAEPFHRIPSGGNILRHLLCVFRGLLEKRRVNRPGNEVLLIFLKGFLECL